MAYLRTIKLSIPTGQAEILAIEGNVLGVVSSSVPLFFEFDNPSAQVTLEAGQEVTYYENSVFNKISVWHGSASEQFVEIVVGKDARLRQEKKTSDVAVIGDVDVNIVSSVPLVVSGVTLTATNIEIDQKAVTVAGAVYTVTAAGVAVTTAANKDRRAIHFRNTSSTAHCYMAAFSAANKEACPILLEAGGVLLIDDRSAGAQWKAFSDSVDISLSVQEVVE